MVTLRPSALPKLAACPRWEGCSDAGQFAARGTILDEQFRLCLSGKVDQEWWKTADTDDRVAVRWAVDIARLLAGPNPVEGRESELKIEAEGMVGTADALCEGARWSMDLKSGRKSDYKLQQATYALGFMDRFFLDEWTVHVAYCDLQEIETLTFDRPQAERLIREVKAQVRDESARPTPCDYCSWCALRWSCKERLAGVAWFLGKTPDELVSDISSLPPDKLSALLSVTHEIAREDGLHDELKAQGLKYATSGTPLPGFTLCPGRTTESVPSLQLQHSIKGRVLIKDAGWQAICDAIPTMTGNKFRALWTRTYGHDTPVPEEVIITKTGSSFLKKQAKKKNPAS